MSYIARTENSKDDWETPPYFFKLLDGLFHFTLDPCASKENFKCVFYYTEEDNGLKYSWEGHTVFVNPPFSNIAPWVKKCYEEGQKYATTVVMIIPSRTDTRYWHDYVMKAKEIWFCKGRVNFLRNGIRPKNGATFPLAVVIFKRIKAGGNVFLIQRPVIAEFIHK